MIRWILELIFICMSFIKVSMLIFRRGLEYMLFLPKIYCLMVPIILIFVWGFPLFLVLLLSQFLILELILALFYYFNMIILPSYPTILSYTVILMITTWVILTNYYIILITKRKHFLLSITFYLGFRFLYLCNCPKWFLFNI